MADNGLTHQALNQILNQSVCPALNRGAAGALTVAFFIRRADHGSRGEFPSDDLIKEEVRKIFYEMQGLTDVHVASAQAQHKAPTKSR